MEMDILEKCAYIKGLAEGLNLDVNTPEGKVLNAIIDLLSDITATVADMDDEVATLGDYIEEIDHDLGEVEEYLYDEECDCECDDDCDCCDCEDDECDCCDCEYMEAMCPSCGEKICFDNEIEPEDLICPACGKAFSEDK
ncbi:MAG: hypothetical protein J6K52_07850 [Clostridia bacterium]|nr:hypothetical protein [Clostridia bacterium]MBQ7788450.1 hypothetical protein [Clostridia bacterium]